MNVELVGYTFDRHPEGIEGVTLWFRATSWSGRARVAHPDRVLAVMWAAKDQLPSPLFSTFSNAIKKGIWR